MHALLIVVSDYPPEIQLHRLNMHGGGVREVVFVLGFLLFGFEDFEMVGYWGWWVEIERRDYMVENQKKEEKTLILLPKKTVRYTKIEFGHSHIAWSCFLFFLFL
ncbi:hypothetical protein O6P43_019573 [Quillaja saponaria]|uniref:Uncharacterized protein n=1 Tax=Quillaja saponaria TaxID=32244 RepID=A0AAD7PKF7_QUISA|nr:hypothetical protein O6P43_019573 [Quillaja saponaria]